MKRSPEIFRFSQPYIKCAGIAEIIQHPDYDRSETVLNDICLLRLKNKLEYGEKVQPACLPKQGMSMETLYNDIVGEQKGQNNECFVAGWGYRQDRFTKIKKN